MKMKILINASVIASTVMAACADSGVQENTIGYVRTTMLLSPSDIFNIGPTEMSYELGFDADADPDANTGYGLTSLTPVDTMCQTTSYALSLTPIFFTTHPQDITPNNPTATQTITIFLQVPLVIGHINNVVAHTTKFYYCAVFNDGSKYCHTQPIIVTVTCPAGPLQYQTTIPSIDFTFQPQDMFKIIVFPTYIEQYFQKTTACPGGNMDSYGVYIDNALTTIFSDDSTYQLANSGDSTATTMTITRTTALNFKSFFIIATSKTFQKSQSQILQMNIYICGFETIFPSTTPAGFAVTYQRDTGTKILAHTSQTSLLQSSWVGCPIQSYDIVTDQVLGTSLGGTPIQVDSTNILIDTSSQYNGPLWLRTYSSGGNYYDIQLNIIICGFETILGAPTPIELVYQLNSGIYSYVHTAQTGLLSSSVLGCPIQSFQLIDQLTMATFTDTSVVIDPTSITTDSTSATHRTLLIRAISLGGVKYDLSLMIYFCGLETISATSTILPIEITYQREFIVRTLSHQQESGKLSSSLSQCPIQSFDIITNVVTGNLLGGSPISVDMENIYTDTSLSFNQPLWLRAYSKGGITFDIKLSIYVCGFEKITASSPIYPLQVKYETGSGLQKFDYTPQISLLQSSWAECPITSIKLIQDQTLGTIYGGTQIALVEIWVFIKTNETFNSHIWLRVSTSGSQYYDIPLNVTVEEPQCQPQLNLIPIKCTPKRYWHKELFEISSKIQYEEGASISQEQLLKILNLDEDLIGKNTSMQNTDSTAISLKVEPPIGKQIIKFDSSTQSIKVSSFDQRFTGIYNCVLTVICEKRIRIVNFQINFQNIKLEEFNQSLDNKIGQQEKFDPYKQKEYQNMKKFYAKITKIQKNGEVSIKFSEPLNNPNITQFNQTLNLFIKPAPQTFDYIENKDAYANFVEIQGKKVLQSSEFLNYTWELLNLTENNLYIKLKFRYPFNVSTSDKLRDQLIIHLDDPLQFRSKQMSFLDENLMIWPIRRQFPDIESESELLFSSELFLRAVQVCTLSSFVLQFFISLLLGHLSLSFQNLQLILNMSNINISGPSNAIFFLNLIKQIVNVEILDSEITTEVWLDFEKDEKLMMKIKEEENREHLLNDHLIDMGYNNFNAVLNMGGLIFSLAFYFILLVYGAVIKLIQTCFEKLYPNIKKQAKRQMELEEYQEKINKKYKNEEIKTLAKKEVAKRRDSQELQHEGGEIIIYQSKRSFSLKQYICLKRQTINTSRALMFQYLFTFVTESFMNLLITGILWWDGKILAENYEQENDHDLSQIINNIVGITIIVLVSVVTFVYIMTVFFISIERAKSAEFQQYFGFVLEKIRIQTRLQLLYNIWFTIRRIIIVWVVVFMQRYTGMQLLLFIYLNLASMICIGQARALKGTTFNKNELISEFATSIVTITQICFTEYVFDPQQQFQMGWAFISLIILSISYFQFFILREILWIIKLYYLRGYNYYCKPMKKPNEQQTVNKRSINVMKLNEVNSQKINQHQHIMIQNQEEIKKEYTNFKTFGEIQQDDIEKDHEYEEEEKEEIKKNDQKTIKLRFKKLDVQNNQDIFSTGLKKRSTLEIYQKWKTLQLTENQKYYFLQEHVDLFLLNLEQKSKEELEDLMDYFSKEEEIAPTERYYEIIHDANMKVFNRWIEIKLQ